MQTFFYIMGLLLLFGAVVFMAYVTTKILGKTAGKTQRGKNLKIVETLSLGFDKQVILVKAGEKFVLLSSCGKTLTYLTDASGVDEEIAVNNNISLDATPFKAIFDKYMGKQREKKIDEVPISTNLRSGAEKIKYTRNLQMTRDRDDFNNEKNP